MTVLATRGLGKTGGFLATSGLGKGQLIGGGPSGSTPFHGIRNIAAWVKVNDAVKLLVNPLIHPEADGLAPTAQGGYGFLAFQLREQPLADAICCFAMPTQVHECFLPDAKGEARCDPYTTEDHYTHRAPVLTGEADAEADLFLTDSAALVCNPIVPAWGVKNPSDEELVMMVNAIRRRRR